MKCTKTTEVALLLDLKKSSQTAFATLFDMYYRDLVLYAGNIIRQQSVCEDIVQNILLKIWTERQTLNIETSLKTFLLRSVKNSCIDEIRHRRIVDNYAEKSLDILEYDDALSYVLYSELAGRIELAIKSLPEKQREVFLMSRNQDLKYKEIAQKLNVSQRTVEDRMSKALAQLRIELRDFLVIVTILFFATK